MNRIRGRRSGKPGAAMSVALVVLVLLFLTGLGLLRLGLQARVYAARTSDEIAAQVAADAGLTKALYEMNEKLKVKPWSDSTLPQATDEAVPGSDAVFSYTIIGDSDSGYTIESIGKGGQAEQSVTCSLRLRGLFEHLIFVLETLDIKNNCFADGYNSDTGETGVKIQIGTKSTAPGSIVIGSGGTIDGDVVVGVGGDPETVIVNESTITGETYAAGEEYVLPSISPPLLPDKGTIDVQTTPLLTPADNGKYAGIISNSSILEIDGGDVVLHVTGNIDMDNGSEIRIKDGSSLTLYVDGNIAFRNNAGINNLTGVCESLILYSTGGGKQVFELKNNSDAFGAIYAPNADVTLMNNADLYGSIVAKSLDIMNNGAFHYDAALRSASVNDEGVGFVVNRWQE